ncbi:peptidoglycan DD-metalloendopeptidase family protein [Thiothrix lacustris]|uniref:Peptidoglycan DD-metalloendopeptidase family protein n=1 Tax=Thiothrix lacustris TaxID=525917 RepID=A0ABY9MMB8_9GAMM|nr:peptidoglycan DD-metalloendopeptidase family protein [Thiothrix lacustris]WML89355.1 peptidoglycan DD-metalloendopeptidase family protein [Thiothrix lacustris]
MKFYPHLFCLLILSSWSPLHAAEPSKQQQLQRDIRELSNVLTSQKGESKNLQSEVTQLEKRLGEITDKNYQTEKKAEATLAKLEASGRKQFKLDAELATQKSGLAQQLQALYTAGEQSHLRLLLRQDAPSDISRTIRYFEYMNTSRVKNIQTIQKTLKEIESVRLSVEKDNNELQTLNKTLEQQKTDIQKTLNARSTVLETLRGDIRFKEKQLGKLKTEEANLQAVIDRLARKAEAQAAEVAKKSTETETNSPPKTVTANKKTVKQAKADDNNSGTPTKTRFTPNQAFSTLRGKLSWPVQGKIIHSYGSSRNEKQRWRGVVLAATGGTKVRAVAKGQVVFAGWMDGYGHLIIIEHDNNYMSLYGYNRAIYKKEGTIVNANETIAAVGNSSGQSQDALYFEIRQGTSPQNPARWCR